MGKTDKYEGWVVILRKIKFFTAGGIQYHNIKIAESDIGLQNLYVYKYRHCQFHKYKVYM